MCSGPGALRHSHRCVSSLAVVAFAAVLLVSDHPAHARGFGATDGNTLGTLPGSGDPVDLAKTAEAIIFGTSSGVPPSGGVEIINNRSPGGPLLDRISISPSTGRQDENLDGHFCTRAAFTGAQPLLSPVATTASAAGHRAPHRRSSWATRRRFRLHPVPMR